MKGNVNWKSKEVESTDDKSDDLDLVQICLDDPNENDDAILDFVESTEESPSVICKIRD